MSRWCDCEIPSIRHVFSRRCMECGKLIRDKKGEKMSGLIIIRNIICGICLGLAVSFLIMVSV